MFLYNKAELTPPSVLSPNSDSKVLQLSEMYQADLQRDLLKLVETSRRSEIAPSLMNMRRSLTSLHRVAALLAFEAVSSNPMSKQALTFIETSGTTINIQKFHFDLFLICFCVS